MTENQYDSLVNLVLRMYDNYRINPVTHINTLSNGYELFTRDEVNDYATQDMFVRKSFIKEDIILYLKITYKEIINRMSSLSNNNNTLREIQDIYNVLQLISEEEARRGELPGI